MAEFYLVRHGQASFGAADYDQLSTLGEQQSVWLGQYFAERDIQFDRVIMGAQKRHRQTAEAICSGMGSTLEFTAHPELNEYDFSALCNSLGDDHPELTRLVSGNKVDFYKGLKQVMRLWSSNELKGSLPESWADFSQRVSNAKQLIQQSGAQRVLVVSSGGAIGMMTRQVLDASVTTAIELSLQVKNSSFSHCYFNEKSVRLASFNNIAHLDQPDRFDAITYT
ncbi:histidine phosphatase family protein [Alcaligenaceae bacterium]|nr:histidine phosphatase family protein [Alcaligenaceae bacterium]